MKRTIFLATVITSVLGLQGCITNSVIKSSPSEGQKAVFIDGRDVLISTKRNSVSIGPVANTLETSGRGEFIVAVKNGTRHDILFSTNHITAHTVENDQSRALKVFSHDELVKEEKERQVWAAIAAGISGAADSYSASSAGYSYSTPYSYGNNIYTPALSTPTYNYSAAEAARQEASARSETRFARLETEGRANLMSLSTVLKKQTIFPGETHGGIVVVELPEPSDQLKEIFFNVNVDGEIHEFKFTQKKI